MRVIYCLLICLALSGCAVGRNEAVAEYDVTLLPSDFGGGSAYEIGANEEGQPVFVNPDQAFKQIVVDNKAGVKAIQKEYHLLPLMKWTWKKYGYYGWQITHEDEDVVNQAYEISRFFEIYKNSF